MRQGFLGKITNLLYAEVSDELTFRNQESKEGKINKTLCYPTKDYLNTILPSY